ncbi:hypothetical protein ACWNG8_06845 [Aeromonas veronii]
MRFSEAVAELAAAYGREPGVEPLDFASTGTYRQFAEAAELDGLIGVAFLLMTFLSPRKETSLATARKG